MDVLYTLDDVNGFNRVMYKYIKKYGSHVSSEQRLSETNNAVYIPNDVTKIKDG
jgi:hypothetical protein